MKKFKRYYSGSAKRTQPGKGSDRRETQVSEEKFTRNWCNTFGHDPDIATLICVRCGHDCLPGGS